MAKLYYMFISEDNADDNLSITNNEDLEEDKLQQVGNDSEQKRCGLSQPTYLISMDCVDRCEKV